MSLHSDTLSLFWDNPIWLKSAVCLAPITTYYATYITSTPWCFTKWHSTIHTEADGYGNQYICVTNYHGYVPLVVSTSWSFPHSWLITGFVTRLTQRVLPVEEKLLTFPEHLSSPPIFSGIRVTQSLVFMCMFCRWLFVLLYFFFWLLCCLLYYDIRILITLWYLQTLLMHHICTKLFSLPRSKLLLFGKQC